MHKNKQITGRLSVGFTLIEILVVLAIIGLMAGLVGPKVMKQFTAAKTKTARLQIEDLAGALDMYRLDIGRYPGSDQGLAALVTQPGNAKNWNGPYLRKSKVPQDPWGQAYHYRAPGEHGEFDLYSLGADNAQGGEGDSQDVSSWQ